MSAPADDAPRRWPRLTAPLGRHGLIVGVVVLVVIAVLGGTALLRSGGRTAVGVADALAPLAGFPQATPARIAIGSSPHGAVSYAAIVDQGVADWRAQFARAGLDWADPAGVARPPGGASRARDVLAAGTALGNWAQQLIGIPGLLEVARRQGRMTPAAVRAETADLVACLAGAWGRSMIAPAALTAAAPAGTAAWVARGAHTGVPSSCGSAVGT